MEERKKELYEKARQQVYDLASNYESSVHGCSQATMAAIMSVVDIPKELFRAIGPFQGGMSYHNDENPCGAYSAGVALIGYFAGRTWEEFHGGEFVDGEEVCNGPSCTIVRKFTDRWKEIYDNTSCGGLNHELFGRHFDCTNSEEDYEAFQEMGGYVDKCNVVCGRAAQLILDVLYEEGYIFK